MGNILRQNIIRKLRDQFTAENHYPIALLLLLFLLEFLPESLNYAKNIQH